MVKYFRIHILLCIILPLYSVSQSDSAFVKGGMIKAALTISPSIQLNRNQHNIYLNGDLEYFIDKKISLRGEVLFFVDSQEDKKVTSQNSILSFGAFYHFSKNKNDLFIGFQPGLSLVQLNSDFYKNNSLQAIPNISFMAGYTLYLFEYFNFFINCRYVHATLHDGDFGPVPLSEIIVSGGLGWQIRMKK